jgi:hypothetical protein
MNIRNLFIVLASFVLLLPLRAQEDERMEHFRSQRVSFLTEHMKLTPAEAQRFWPVYNEFATKREAINREKVKLNRRVAQSSANMGDKESTELATLFILLDKQELQLREEYHRRFLSIIPARKVMLLYQGETQFKAYLLKQIRANSDKKK